MRYPIAIHHNETNIVSTLCSTAAHRHNVVDIAHILILTMTSAVAFICLLSIHRRIVHALSIKFLLGTLRLVGINLRLIMAARATGKLLFPRSR